MAEKIDAETEKKIQELQFVEQNIQALLMQKQAFQMELSETENAFEEVKKTKSEIYKIVGQIMLKADKENTEKELSHKKEILSLRIKKAIFKIIAKIGKKFTSSKSMKNLLYKFVRESDYKDLDENTKKTMVNLISVDLKPVLSNIHVPTLLIWGAQDKTEPLSYGVLMNNLIKNSRLEIIKDARHSPQYTHPLEIANLITDFIKN